MGVLFAWIQPELIEPLTTLISTGFVVISGIAAGIWAVIRFLDDKEKERVSRKQVEQQKLAQLKADEEGRRSERVTSLMSDFGKTADHELRTWTMMALSMYPEETKRLLAMSLGQFDDETAKGIIIALINIGEKSLPELIRLNKIARLEESPEIDDLETNPQTVWDSAKLLARTQDGIVQLVRYLDAEVIAKYNLSELDLKGSSFEGADINGIILRKCNLDGVNFRKTKLKKGVFRGASINGAHFFNASLNKADFTGAKGTINGIKAYFIESNLSQAVLDESNLDAADLSNAQLTGTYLKKASLNGAQMHHAVLEKAHLDHVVANKLKATGLNATSTKFNNAEISEATIHESVFERCRLNGVTAMRVGAKKCQFINSNLGGANFTGANLSGTTFKGCNIGGAVFHDAKLDGATFTNCENAESAQFDDGYVIK